MARPRSLLALPAVAALLATGGVAPAQPAPKGQIDHLLRELQAARDDQAAAGIEQRLHALWRRAGSPASVMLLERGVQEMQSNAPDAAAADLGAALTLDPDYAEAYNDRAAARLMQGDYAGAAADAGQALRREPRHFAALQTLSRIAEARGDWKTALEAWQNALAIDPQTHDGQARLNLLRRHAEGEAT